MTALTIAAMLALITTTALAATAAPPATVPDARGGRFIRPATLQLTVGASRLTIERLRWSEWTGTRAAGRGIVVIDNSLLAMDPPPPDELIPVRVTLGGVGGCGVFRRARVDGKVAGAGDFVARRCGRRLLKVKSRATADNTFAYVQDGCVTDNFRRPKSILLSGDPDGPRAIAGRLVWRRWGRAQATATGELLTAPPCASRSRTATGNKIRLTIRDRRRQPGAPEVDRFVYRRLDVAVDGVPELSGRYALTNAGIQPPTPPAPR